MYLFLNRFRPMVLILGLLVLLNGCFFGSTLSVTVLGDSLFISAGSGEIPISIGICSESEPNYYDCFLGGITSGLETLTAEELLLTLIILDPLVLQVPEGTSGFAGSFLHMDSGTSMPLAITEGLSTIDIDVDRTLTAEPGTQFVVVGFPPGAPTTGDFSFNLNFDIPPGATSVPVKPIITGLVELIDGSTYYPPVLPCVEAMAAAPEILIPVPVPGDTLVLPPLTADLGCDGTVYNFIPSGPMPTAIPTLGSWALFALITALAGAAMLRARRDRREGALADEA